MPKVKFKTKTQISADSDAAATSITIDTRNHDLMNYLWNAGNDMAYDGMARMHVRWVPGKGREYGSAMLPQKAGFDGYFYAYSRGTRKPYAVQAVIKYEGRMPKKVRELLRESKGKTRDRAFRSAVDALF